jgi:predicted PurR-regulated permease PerM
MTETRFRQAFLLLLVTAISAAFIAMIRVFLLTILLAAIFAGLSYPVYEWMLGRVRGRKALAAIATLLVLLVLVMAPLLAVLGAGANEALRVTETIRPRLQQLVDQPGEFDSRLRALPASSPTERRSSPRPASSSEARAPSSSPHSPPPHGRRRSSSSFLCTALHDVFLPDRRPGPA